MLIIFLSIFFVFLYSLFFAWGTESALEGILGHEFYYWDYWLLLFWIFLAWTVFCPPTKSK